MKNGTLLFFFCDETCTSIGAVVPTLSRLSREVGVDFEIYCCSRPDSWQGKVLPLVGHGHMEQFYYLANFYEKILYCSISDRESFQFRREVIAFGGEVISTRKNDETVSFYQDIYGYFGRPLPKTVFILPAKKPDGHEYASYCYPDILHSDALGVNEGIWASSSAQLLKAGVTTVKSLYCDVEGAEAYDSLRPGDDYASVTERIARRHLSHARQIGFIDPGCIDRWLAYFCREDVVTVYEDMKWVEFMKTVATLAEEIGNMNIVGSQNVYIERSGKFGCLDDVFTEMARYGLYGNIVGINPRIGFTLQTEKSLPRDWLDNPSVPTPWDDEYSDEFLLEKLDKRATPVCFMLYAADLGHLPVLSHVINAMCLDGMRAGIAFPASWYDYQPELLEQLYLPLEQGGVCPNIEPVISSGGVAVLPEAEGFLSPDLLTELLKKAKERIKESIGERRVPRGYYPWQDSSPYYKANSGKPQFDAVAKAGFEYYVTYKDGGTRGKIAFEGRGMTAMTQQVPQWFPGAGSTIEHLKKWEAECAERREEWKKDKSADAFDYIMFGFDMPFFGLAPSCYEGMETLPKAYAAMHHICDAMQYVRRTGGKDGNLFLVKPHELYRFVKLAEERGILKN